MLFNSKSNDIKGKGVEIHFFYTPNCHHCAKQKQFNLLLLKKYKVKIISHDITNPSERKLFDLTAKQYDITQQNFGVPLTIVRGKAIIGFKSQESTGLLIEESLQQGDKKQIPLRMKNYETHKIPFIGKVDINNYSLTTLAVLLGLVDGFNPCAMWALVFLIGLVMGLHDNRKLWLLVGTFVFSSGVLYFLFMAAWLNAFLLIGYMHPIVILIGGFAIILGVLQIRDFFTKDITCTLPTEQKQKVMQRMKLLAQSPLTIATVTGIILLAFVVNLIEFVCSSFIPAIFTQALALHNLPVWQYYFYLLLYTISFMLDDLIIFSSAVFAISKISIQYTKWCKLIGGFTLLVVGVALLIIPNT
jgi:thiol-disulfide isomerase/thioredoxin